MKAPNNRGSVELITSKKDKNKRRKPYRVRIIVDWDINSKDLTIKPIQKTIGYTETKAKGNILLDEYHNNLYSLDMNNVSLKYLFGLWYEYKKKKIVDHKSYLSMFKQYKEIELLPFNNITTNDLQRIIDEKLNDKTGGYQHKVISIFHQLYEYAKANNMKVGADVSKLVITKKKESRSTLHKPFTEEEIKILWDNRSKVIDLVLICIYTGIRPGEMLIISEVHDDYFVSGSKTEAGKNRIIPLHQKIKNIFHNAWLNEYFKDYSSEDSWYQVFKKKLKTLNLDNHTPYDTRHTFATAAKKCKMDEHSRKLIMGHYIEDLTDRVYTHKLTEELISQINKIDI